MPVRKTTAAKTPAVKPPEDTPGTEPAKDAPAAAAKTTAPSGAGKSFQIIQGPRAQHTMGGLFEAVAKTDSGKIVATAQSECECWAELHKKLKAAGYTMQSAVYAESQHNQGYVAWLAAQKG